jgi:hypothetical protein
MYVEQMLNYCTFVYLELDPDQSNTFCVYLVALIPIHLKSWKGYGYYAVKCHTYLGRCDILATGHNGSLNPGQRSLWIIQNWYGVNTYYEHVLITRHNIPYHANKWGLCSCKLTSDIYKLKNVVTLCILVLTTPHPLLQIINIYQENTYSKF